MTKFYKLSVIILISYYFSFVICNSPRKLGKIFKTGELPKNIFPEKEYWRPPENIEETPRIESPQKEQPSRDQAHQTEHHKRLKAFTPIGLLTDSHIDGIDGLEAPPKNEHKHEKIKMIADTLIRESQKLKQEVSPETEDTVWSEMESRPANKNIKLQTTMIWEPENAKKHIQMWKEKFLKKKNEAQQAIKDKHFDDLWEEDNSIKEILRWRDKPAEIINEELVWKKKYAELGNSLNDDQQNAKKDTPHWTAKKPTVVELQWKPADNGITENKPQVQKEDVGNDVGQPEYALPRKEFDASNAKIKKIVAEQLNSFLEHNNIRSGLEKKKKHHSKKSKSQNSKDDHKSKTKCIEKCFTSRCEVECIGRQASAACSADSCSALTKGQDSASLCTGQLCHAMCFHKQCIAACDGPICFGKCEGKACHAISQGRSSQSICSKDECMAYSYGPDVHAKCSGKRCQAQCIGVNCVASCEGKKCVAGCSGEKCTANCVGKNCRHVVHMEPERPEGSKMTEQEQGQPPENTPSDEDEDPDDGYFGNKNFIEKNKNSKDTKKIAKVSNDRLHIDFEPTLKEEHKDKNVKLDYSIGLNLNDKLADYLKYELEHLRNSGLLRQLPKLSGLF